MKQKLEAYLSKSLLLLFFNMFYMHNLYFSRMLAYQDIHAISAAILEFFANWYISARTLCHRAQAELYRTIMSSCTGWAIMVSIVCFYGLGIQQKHLNLWKTKRKSFITILAVMLAAIVEFSWNWYSSACTWRKPAIAVSTHVFVGKKYDISIYNSEKLKE